MLVVADCGMADFSEPNPTSVAIIDCPGIFQPLQSAIAVEMSIIIFWFRVVCSDWILEGIEGQGQLFLIYIASGLIGTMRHDNDSN
jgi:hypothetical protein